MASRSHVCAIDALDDYAQGLLQLTLAQRESLPRAANNRPIAPSDAYAAQVWKDMSAEKSAEFRRLLAVGITNLRDGAPLALVTARARREIAIYEVEAGTYRPRSIVALTRRETREQAMVDLAQLRVAVNESDSDALQQLAGEITSYRTVFDELAWEVDRRVALLARGSNPADGPTRPSSRGPLIVIK